MKRAKASTKRLNRHGAQSTAKKAPAVAGDHAGRKNGRLSGLVHSSGAERESRAQSEPVLQMRAAARNASQAASSPKLPINPLELNKSLAAIFFDALLLVPTKVLSIRPERWLFIVARNAHCGRALRYFICISEYILSVRHVACRFLLQSTEVGMNPQGNAPVLITGGTGFIGSYLAMELMERGENVVLFDRDYDLRRLKGFGDAPGGRFDKVKDRLTFVQGDLSLLPHVLALFDTHEPKSVYHLGALLSAGAEANATMGFQVDIVGTWHVLEAARLYCQHQGKPPVKVLFPSTIASFGEHIAPELKNNVPNEAPQFPTTIYGVAKLSSERLGEYYNRRGWVNFRALRFPSVIGAARGPGGTTVYSTLMIQMPADGKAYEVYVSQGLRLAILYVKDAVAALRALHDADEPTLGSSDQTTRRVFNLRGIVGKDGLPPSAQQIADAVKKRVPGATITFKPDAAMEKTVGSFGILEDQVAREEWLQDGTLKYLKLEDAVDDFVKDVDRYGARLKRLELFG